MKISEAKQITGGLSSPSKMPGKAYNLSAFKCQTGSILSQNPNSVCSGCYARKGRYGFPMVQKALNKRLDSLSNPRWVDAMVTLIKKQSPEHFRWHDSGDIQSLAHLLQIEAVANATPDTMHWLPTKEYGYVTQYLRLATNPPWNLIIRVSAPNVNQYPPLLRPGTVQSMVVSDTSIPRKGVYQCPAPTQGNKCGDCRACWDPTIETVAYHKH
jgi:hypothetical protein